MAKLLQTLTFPGIEGEYYVIHGTPFNFLDNSNFTQIINQRGQELYVGERYGIDRWFSYSAGLDVSPQSFTYGGEQANGYGYAYQYLDIFNTDHGNAAVLCQRIEPEKSVYMLGKNFTFAICYVVDGENRIAVCSGLCTNKLIAQGASADTRRQFSASVNDHPGIRSIEVFKNTDQTFEVRINFNPAPAGQASLKWAALYEGEYTVETLPPYKPKGYMVELNECRRYYQKFGNSFKTGVITTGGTMLRLGIPLPVPLRLNKPSMTIISASGLRTVNGSNMEPSVTASTVSIYPDGAALVDLTIEAIEGVTNNTPIALYFSAELSADL